MKRKGVNEIRLFPWELESMDEYSCTLPSGQTLWKMWKRDVNEPARHHSPLFGEEAFKRFPVRWKVGQYIPHKDPKYIGIRWFEVKILEGPKPRGWEAPDWANLARYDREWEAELAAKRAEKAQASTS